MFKKLKPWFVIFILIAVLAMGADLRESADGLVSVTSITSLASETQTTLYTVPSGKTLILTFAKLRVAGDVGASGAVTIGQNGAVTDFVSTTNLDNADASGDVVLIAPIPSATPATNKEYTAGEVIEIDVSAAGNAVAGTLYLFGILDDA